MPKLLQALLMEGLIVTLVGCAPAASTGLSSPASPSSASAHSATLIVSAAASLADAFNEIGQTFEAEHPTVKVEFNFAGSQQLAQQLSHGAPADVFASASDTQMSHAIKAGRIITGTPKIFARNRLVVVIPKDNPAGIHELKDLTKPGLKFVLAAKEVPVGQYALDFLDRAVQDPAFGASFKDATLKNVVSYEQDVKAVLSKVALGEADAGIIYATDVAGPSANKVIALDIPDALNPIASYPIAKVSDSQNADLAQFFVDSVLDRQGQAILAKYGFIIDSP